MMNCKCLACCKVINVSDHYYNKYKSIINDTLVMWDSYPTLVCNECRHNLEYINSVSLIYVIAIESKIMFIIDGYSISNLSVPKGIHFVLNTDLRKYTYLKPNIKC